MIFDETSEIPPQRSKNLRVNPHYFLREYYWLTRQPIRDGGSYLRAGKILWVLYDLNDLHEISQLQRSGLCMTDWRMVPVMVSWKKRRIVKETQKDRERIWERQDRERERERALRKSRERDWLHFPACHHGGEEGIREQRVVMSRG